MATGYGIASTLVTSDLVYAVNLKNSTIITEETGNIGPNGGYQVKFRHDTAGCGNPDSGIFVELNDNIPWTRITFEWLGLGTSACWSFNGGSYGADGWPPSGYLQSFDANQDIISRTYLTWEVPAYQSHNRINGCDTNPDNFFRFNASEYKSLFMSRRRDTTGNRAGVHFGRSCNNVGDLTIIRNIRIW